MPPDNDFETFSREFDRVFTAIDGPTLDGTIRTNMIHPIDQAVTAIDYDGDATISSHLFNTPFLEFDGIGSIELDREHFIARFNLVDIVKQLSREEKRKVLELLLEGFDDITTEKPAVPKKVDHLRNLLSYSKKSTS